MSQPKVFVTRVIPEKGMEILRRSCEAQIWTEEMPPAREALLAGVRGVDGLLCLLTDRIDGEVMDAAGPGLKVISNMAVGVDNVDVAEATRRGIQVGNTPDILTDSTADMAFGLLMAAARRIVESHNSIPAGAWKTWSPGFMLGVDVHHATLGIVGFGRIGKAVARRARGFEMRILFYDPSCCESEKTIPEARPVDLDTLLVESDIITIHTLLNPETRGMFNARTFSKMKRSAILINTARGPVVDQQALYQALAERQIAGAALDVTDPEPLPLDSPLLTLDNIIITPHIASATKATRDRMATMAAENLAAGLRGERLPNCVNPEVQLI